MTDTMLEAVVGAATPVVAAPGTGSLTSAMTDPTRDLVLSPRTRWYGLDPAWSVPFEQEARREHGRALCVDVSPCSVTYRHRGLEVPGRLEPVPVTIRFHRRPPYPTWGLLPQEFPRVYADLGAVSPHRHDGDALCLYYPTQDPTCRWTPDEGLFALLNLTRDHLFFELHWRETGRDDGGVWLAPEAPHLDLRGAA